MNGGNKVKDSTSWKKCRGNFLQRFVAWKECKQSGKRNEYTHNFLGF